MFNILYVLCLPLPVETADGQWLLESFTCGWLLHTGISLLDLIPFEVANAKCEKQAIKYKH